MVIEIRKEYKSGAYTMVAIAQKYGIHASTVRQIIMRKTWKHVI